MNSPITPSLLALLCSAFLTVGEGALAGGPLNSPVGAIAPTAKPLSEIEPRIAINATNTPGDADSLFKITQPGSYYLTGNFTGVAGKHGIEIAVSGVTLDLNGFDLVGVAGSYYGVVAFASSGTSITVVNGSVRNWGDAGVALYGGNHRVEGVLASGNAEDGILVDKGCVVTNSAAFNNAGYGMRASVSCTVSNCSAYGNTGFGILAGASGTLSNCAAYQNTGSGFTVFNGSTVSYCAADSNGGSGFGFAGGNTITGCSAQYNTLDGIVCQSACTIRDNTCGFNGNGGTGAGIRVTGADNRIEGNNCTSGDRGIGVEALGNLIVKNSCSGNTINYDIVTGNRYGTIVNITASTSASINGNSSPSTLTTTDAWANFSY